MSLLFDIFIIVFLFSIFAVSHSLLAAFNVKEKITAQVGTKIAFYRLFFNVSSILTFLAIYALSPKPNIVIYDLQFPYDIVVFGIQVLGVVGFFWSASYLDGKEFLGITQIQRYFNGTYVQEELDEHQELIVVGPFKYSRHPIYFYSIIMLGFRPSMDLFYFVFFICMAIYFYIGAMYEERNLEKKYGAAYFEYKKHVPRLVPNLFNGYKTATENT
ncbi:MAG: isoprenylcysteine carboxylmethyltransferase family protein [Ignavibacteriae bacterium]|nr:isoprenylcysteine carboxylmethyltransferase family protein [Ignavibacteriota bacterium]